MKCPVCGNLNDNDAKYCSSCGANLQVSNTYEQQARSVTSTSYNPKVVYAKPAMILGIISLSFGIICCFGPISIAVSILAGISAIILSILSIKTEEKGRAITGLVCGIIGLLLGITLLSVVLLFTDPQFLIYLQDNYPELWEAIEDALQQYQ